MDKDNFTAAKGQAGSENVSLRSAAADVIKNLARSAKRAAKKDTSAPERPVLRRQKHLRQHWPGPAERAALVLRAILAAAIVAVPPEPLIGRGRTSVS